MRYGDHWPAPQTGGGPAVSPPRPVRDRLARVLAYESRRVDRAPRIMPWAAPRATQTAGESGGYQ
jgi:hypothetical protein